VQRDALGQRHNPGSAGVDRMGREQTESCAIAVEEAMLRDVPHTQVLQQRAEALMRAFKETPSPRYLVADAQLSCVDNAA
jgi:hypothetical protein